VSFHLSQFAPSFPVLDWLTSGVELLILPVAKSFLSKRDTFLFCNSRQCNPTLHAIHEIAERLVLCPSLCECAPLYLAKS
jgi:hypothetical protein